MIAHLDAPTPRGVSDCLAAHHDLIRGTPLEPILEPRRVQAPPGYHSTKCVSAGLFLLLGQGRIKDELGEPPVPTEITAHGIAYQVIRHRVAIFFGREDLARAVAATDLPHDFTLDDLDWPLAGSRSAVFRPSLVRSVSARGLLREPYGCNATGTGDGTSRAGARNRPDGHGRVEI